MYISIQELQQAVNMEVTVTELYPMYNNGISVIPMSKIGQMPMEPFTRVRGARLSTNRFNKNALMTKEQYFAFLESEQSLMESKGNRLVYSNNNETMYEKYVTNCLEYEILGVAFVSNINTQTEILSTINYYPSECSNIRTRLGFESFWKSASYDLPNIEFDMSTARILYDQYLERFGLTLESPLLENTLMLSTHTREQFIQLVKEAIASTGVDPLELYKIASKYGPGFQESPEFLKYNYYMLNTYRISESLAAGCFVYVFETHYKKVYELSNISHLFNNATNAVLIYPEKEEAEYIASTAQTTLGI